MDILTLSHVSKAFGSNKVIDDLSFSVADHEIFGFIGKNGAGKTTTMKMILGLLPYDRGEIVFNGQRVTFGGVKTNRDIGYLPDVPQFYPFMTPREYLKLCGKIRGLSPGENTQRGAELLDFVGLQGAADKRIQGFSRGMSQRLGIAQALLGNPKLLICDEPTSALDPQGRMEVLELMVKAREKATVVFSSHILNDVENICDKIALVHKGKVALYGDMGEIKAQYGNNGFEVEFDREAQAKILQNLTSGGQPLSPTIIYFPKEAPEDMSRILTVLSENCLHPQRLEVRKPTLETLFMGVINQ